MPRGELFTLTQARRRESRPSSGTTWSRRRVANSSECWAGGAIWWRSSGYPGRAVTAGSFRALSGRTSTLCVVRLLSHCSPPRLLSGSTSWSYVPRRAARAWTLPPPPTPWSRSSVTRCATTRGADRAPVSLPPLLAPPTHPHPTPLTPQGLFRRLMKQACPPRPLLRYKALHNSGQPLLLVMYTYVWLSNPWGRLTDLPCCNLLCI